MSKYRHFILGLAGLVLVACEPKSQTSSSFDVAAMDSLLETAVSQNAVIGVSALIFDEGNVVYEGAFGLRDRERNLPVTDDTVWRIYSMTKPMTSVIIMDMVEDGEISLDDPVSKYIPEIADMKVAVTSSDGSVTYEPQVDPMTIEHLLLHTSGLGYGIFGPINPVEAQYIASGIINLSGEDVPETSMAEKVETLVTLPLHHQPGEAWFYSLSTDVLGRVAEIVDGKPLGEVMKSRIFDPLGMSETGFYVRPDQADRFASNYYVSEDGSFVLEDDARISGFLQNSPFQSGGGGLVSTLDDVAKFAEMMLSGGALGDVRILTEDSVKAIMTARTGLDFPYAQPWLGGATGAGFGYGGSVQIETNAVLEDQYGRWPGQWGWGGAARTNFYIDPDNHAFGIIMLQFFSAEDPVIHGTFQALALKETKG